MDFYDQLNNSIQKHISQRLWISSQIRHQVLQNKDIKSFFNGEVDPGLLTLDGMPLLLQLVIG
jgi:hypothetical protein